MKKKIILLILCLIFINTTVFAAQVRKKEVYNNLSRKDAPAPDPASSFPADPFSSSLQKSASNIITIYYLVDSNGRKVSTQEFDYLDEVNSNLFIARNGDKYGLIDGLGRSLVPFEYQEIKFLKTNILKYKYNNLYGLMSFSGSLILPANYSYLEKIDDRILKYNDTGSVSLGDAGVINNTQVGLMDYNGKVITPPKYSYIDKVDNYLLRVIVSASSEGGGAPPQTALPPGVKMPVSGSDKPMTFVTGKYGLIDYNGKVVLAPQYDYLTKVNNTILKVKKGQSWGRVEFYHGNILNVMMDYQSYW